MSGLEMKYFVLKPKGPGREMWGRRREGGTDHMMLQSFEFGFRRLCAAFGTSFNEARCRVYYEKIGNQLEDENRWTRMVSQWLDSGTAFPKISDLTGMPVFTHREEGPPLDPVESFIRSDCPVVECNAGYIHVGITRSGAIVPLLQENGELMDGFFEREVSFRCSTCNRVAPCGIPDWHGDVTRRSQADLADRSLKRREMALEVKAGKPRTILPGVEV